MMKNLFLAFVCRNKKKMFIEYICFFLILFRFSFELYHFYPMKKRRERERKEKEVK